MGQKVYQNTTEFVLACWAQELPWVWFIYSETSMEKTDFSFAREYQLQIATSPLSAGTPSSLNPHRPCLCCHSLWVQMCVCPVTSRTFALLLLLLYFLPLSYLRVGCISHDLFLFVMATTISSSWEQHEPYRIYRCLWSSNWNSVIEQVWSIVPRNVKSLNLTDHMAWKQSRSSCLFQK